MPRELTPREALQERVDVWSAEIASVAWQEAKTRNVPASCVGQILKVAGEMLLAERARPALHVPVPIRTATAVPGAEPEADEDGDSADVPEALELASGGDSQDGAPRRCRVRLPEEPEEAPETLEEGEP